jgi:molybdopterin-guanine dinucleotide biosynthesis protein A
MISVAGIILCGGRSTRMGRPKALLPFGQECLLQRTARIVASVVEPVVAVAAPEQILPPLPAKVEVVRDEVEGQGPLQGLLAGLERLRGRPDAAYVTGCDTPFLRPEFIRRMISLLGDAAICVPQAHGFHHPLAAVYRIEVAEIAHKLLAEGRMRPTFLFDEAPTRVALAHELADIDPGLESLRNLNTPEDYEAALRNAFDAR